MSVLPLSKTPRPLREARKDFTRRHICAAANILFVERGVAAATMEEIAQAAGIQRSTLYTHFKTKDSILSAIADDYIGPVCAVIARLPGPVPTAEQVKIWIDEFAIFVAAQPGPTELILATGHSLHPPAATLEFGDAMMAALVERSEAFAQANQPGEGFRLAWAQATLSALGWALTYAARHGDTQGSRDQLAVATKLFADFVQDDR